MLAAMRIDDFASLKASMAQEFPDAEDGLAASRSQTGEEYVEISFCAICRSADMAIVSQFVVGRFAMMLAAYLDERRGQIYWRIPLEEDWHDAPQVIRYDESGPDVDFYTDRRCFLDRDWKRYAIYCRLLRSDKPVLAAA